jgi:hypothetical protein
MRTKPLTKEITMLKKIVLAAFAAALVLLVLPAAVSAYGACHVGYTHVGPSGVYHSGETVARGPEGAYAGGRTTAYGAGGAEYHGYSAVGTTGGAAYGAHYSTGNTGGYYYAPGYGHATTTSSYGYVR